MATGTMPIREIARLVLPEHLIAAIGDHDAITLPDTAQLCSCNNVTRGDVKVAIVAGCHDVASFKSETTAGTGAADVFPGLSALLDQRTRSQRGIAVDRRLCEHFAHSRQELFDFIRFHGTALGRCCRRARSGQRGAKCVGRPWVDPRFAQHRLHPRRRSGRAAGHERSCAREHATQRYVLGGASRPGWGNHCVPTHRARRIAQDYDLYVKVTGAPAHRPVRCPTATIARDLAAGDRCRDGVRTCVRQGVADRQVVCGDHLVPIRSARRRSMAIEIERRYRGLRSPHKLKSAVSGCARECAEAQSKDFGVIATENGLESVCVRQRWAAYRATPNSSRPI